MAGSGFLHPTALKATYSFDTAVKDGRLGGDDPYPGTAPHGPIAQHTPPW